MGECSVAGGEFKASRRRCARYHGGRGTLGV